MDRTFIINTFRACNNRTALILSLLYDAILPNRLRERTNAQIAHQHSIMASTIETWLVGDYSVTLAIMIIVVVAAVLHCKLKSGSDNL